MGFILTLICFVALFLFIYIIIDAYPKVMLKIPSAPNVLPIIGHLHTVIGKNTEGEWNEFELKSFLIISTSRTVKICTQDQQHPKH